MTMTAQFHKIGAPTIVPAQRLPLDAIIEDRANPRTVFDEAALAELAESIAVHGVLEPIVVRPDGDGTYEIVFGARRYRATKLAGGTEIPAIVRSYTDAEVLEVQLIENLQREDMSPLDEARGFKRLVDEAKLTAQQIAERIGKSVEYVYARMKLLDAAPKVQQALVGGKLKAEQAVLLARLPAADQAEGLARCTTGWNPMTVKRLREWVKERDDAAKTRARIEKEIGNAKANGKKVVKILAYSMGSPPKGTIPADKYIDAGKAQCEHRALGFFVHNDAEDYQGGSKWVCTNPASCSVHKKKVAADRRNEKCVIRTGRSLAEERKKQARDKARGLAIAAIVQKVHPGLGGPELDIVLDALVDRLLHDDVKAVCKRRGWEGKKRQYGGPDYGAAVREHVAKMSRPERNRFMLELALQHHADRFGAFGRFPKIAKAYRVDVVKLERKVLADMKAKKKPKAKKKGGK